MNKYKKLVNNSIIFTIGTFGSRLISFLMVPLYTHLLSTSEYGVVDLMNTTISFLIPVLTLELGQAALRFSIETKDKIEQNKIFSNISIYAFVITVIIMMGLPILNYFELFENFTTMFVVLLILRVINNLYSQYIRGIGLVREFAINGLLMTFVTVISNIIFLVFLNFKIEGYIISLIIAALTSNLYLLYSTNKVIKFKLVSIDLKNFKEMLVFSIPIIPNSAMWWIINSSTRYFILYFIGTSGNGIYAVANKVPAIISMATSIFAQAWQISSFEEYESESKDKFYTKIFNIYWSFLFISGSAILVILKPLLSFIVEDSFYISWQVSPILILAVIYQSFSSFLGTNYTAAKQTKGSFYTSIYAGVISIITSLLLIPTIGLIGAGLSSAISFIVMFLLRYKDTRKYVKIRLNTVAFLLTNVIYLVQIILLFLIDGKLLLRSELILFVFTLLVNKRFIILILKVINTGIKKYISSK